MIKAYHLYTGADGHSHFDTGHVEEQVLTTATRLRFAESPAGSSYSWHTAPVRQFVLTLCGVLEFTVHDGSSFTLYPGEVLVATDITGSGHHWRLLGADPWKRAYVLFDEDTAANFVKEKV